MTKEELKEQDIRLNKLCFDYQEKEKRIAELEEKISNLLSCKNCSENKGGLLCQKEYEDKCLAQKIQYIKELKEENAELEKTITKMNNVITKTFSNLTKAKEIIRLFLSERFNESEWQNIQNKAEQFLKEVSE